jgi:hypothetical protein
VARLAQYTANPSPQHQRLALYILAYLVGTVDMRLIYNGADGDGLVGYTDSSLGDQADDQHSTLLISDLSALSNSMDIWTEIMDSYLLSD